MSRCLRDRSLWLLSEGGGTQAQRAHVETCPHCARRFRRLARDLVVLGQALREMPPSHAAPHHQRALYLRWLPVAALLAISLAWVGGGLEVWRPAPPAIAVDVHDEAVSYLQAALDGNWPCDGQEPFFHLDCDQQAFTLLEGGP